MVLPVIILGLVVMSTLTVAAVMTAGDEQKSSQAMRQSGEAFYVAEAGLQQTYSQWTTYAAKIDSLEPGDTLDLGEQTLSGNNTYHPLIIRLDNAGGGQPLYQLMVESASDGAFGGRKTLAYLLASGPGGPDTGYLLGDCCDAAMMLKGDLDMSSRAPSGGWRGEIDLSGMDAHPAAWDSADVCSDQLYDKPAVIMTDSTATNIGWTSSDCDPGNTCPITIEGDPIGISQDAELIDNTFDQFGDLTWEDLKDLADHTIGTFGTQIKLHGDDIYPRYNGDGTCDTSHPYNWGSDDPADACFNYFPIIKVRGEVEFNKGWNPERAYGQGLIVMDWDDTQDPPGTELELGREGEFNGIVLGRGCVEIQKGFQFHGALMVNGTYDGISCDAQGAFIDCRGNDSSSGGMCDNTTIQWSQCAVDRVLSNSKLEDYVEIMNPGDGGGARLLVSRSFTEVFQ
jgi:hypothetical protein